MTPLATLPERVVVVGGGGVGKTTLAASLAVRAAGRGERSLVMTFDPSLRLKDALGIGEAPDRGRADARANAAESAARSREVRVELAGASGELYAHLLDARRTFDALVERYSPDDATRSRILGNRFFRHLAGQLAGILEYMAVERLYEAVEAGKFERIVLDTPPTREALEFLDAPRRIVSFLDSGALQVALKPWFDESGHLRPKMLPAAGRPLEAILDRVIGIDLLRDMAEFFQAFAPLFDGFRERATAVDGLLRSSKTGFILVTAAAERNLADTMFFARALKQRGHELVAVVANRVHPAAGPGAPELIRWLGERDQSGVARLRELLPDGPPVLAVPQLAASPADLDRLDAFGRMLEES